MSQDNITLNGALAESTIDFIDSIIDKLKEFMESRDDDNFSAEDFREFLSIPPVVKSNRLKMPLNKSKTTRTTNIADSDRCKHIAIRAPYNRCPKKKLADCEYCKVHYEQRVRNEQKVKDSKSGGKTSFDQKDQEPLITLPGEKGSVYRPSNGHVFGRKNGELVAKGKLANLSKIKNENFKAKIIPLSVEECNRYKEYNVLLATTAMPTEENDEENDEENEEEPEVKEDSKGPSNEPEVKEDSKGPSDETGEVEPDVEDIDEREKSPKKSRVPNRSQITIPKPPRKS